MTTEPLKIWASLRHVSDRSNCAEKTTWKKYIQQIYSCLKVNPNLSSKRIAVSLATLCDCAISIYLLGMVLSKILAGKGVGILCEVAPHKILHALQIGEISTRSITRDHVKAPTFLKLLVLVNLPQKKSTPT